jgi:hypothetical protein
MRKRWSVAALVLLVLAVVGLAQTNVGHAALRGTGLAGSPAGYVALSFAHIGQLPSQLYSQEALLDASFVINNKSAAQRRFDWTILEIKHGQTVKLASGEAAAGYGARTTVNRLVMTSCIGGQLKVEVRLAAPRESIAFVAACWAGGVAP